MQKTSTQYGLIAKEIIKNNISIYLSETIKDWILYWKPIGISVSNKVLRYFSKYF